jgi:hypothetical protein
MAFTTTRSFVGVTVTLAASNTNYNLKTLVDAILAAETGRDNKVVCPGAPRFYRIQAYPGIDAGTGANTKDVLIGDGELSTSRIGCILVAPAAGVPAGELTDRSPINNCDFGDLYAQSSTTNQKLNILLAAG